MSHRFSNISRPHILQGGNNGKGHRTNQVRLDNIKGNMILSSSIPLYTYCDNKGDVLVYICIKIGVNIVSNERYKQPLKSDTNVNARP